MVTIDAHQHFWQPLRGDYDWMPKDDPILSRPYFPADMSETLDRNEIHKTVLVQAAATVNETEYMLGLADASSMVAGVVGWVDLGKDRARRNEGLFFVKQFRVLPIVRNSAFNGQ
jgi:L-fuconolactonase